MNIITNMILRRTGARHPSRASMPATTPDQMPARAAPAHTFIGNPV